jgi:hypothetical protein
MLGMNLSIRVHGIIPPKSPSRIKVPFLFGFGLLY